MSLRMKKRLIVLGSTGSIGTKTLEVVKDFPEHFEIVALSTNSSVELLEQQIKEHHPEAICVCAPEKRSQAEDLASTYGVRLHLGEPGLTELVENYDADVVVVATVGFVGLMPTLRALELKKTVALANKEVLVTAGEIVMARAASQGLTILPIDSEHNAIFQCLNGCGQKSVRNIVLTASGGPFRGNKRDQMCSITPRQALCHPTWSMGPKITIDSATLMNKGFEVIEGCHLFHVGISQVKVVVHPQSTIHSMVEYVDGSIIAQLGVTDMYMPIQNVLFYPERVGNKYPPLDLAKLAKLTFEEPDLENFPCLAYAYEAVERGTTYPTVLNAANEVAVARFLAGEIGFLEIAGIIRRTLDAHKPHSSTLELEQIHAADAWARESAWHL